MAGNMQAERRCDQCGAPAAYTRDGETHCGDCACWVSAMRQGEAYAAAEALGYAVAQARRASLSDEQIRATVEGMFTDEPEAEASYPINYAEVAEGRGDNRWLRGAVPLATSTGGA